MVSRAKILFKAIHAGGPLDNRLPRLVEALNKLDQAEHVILRDMGVRSGPPPDPHEEADALTLANESPEHIALVLEGLTESGVIPPALPADGGEHTE